MLTSQQKGTVAELAVITYLTSKGYIVAKPVIDGLRYDILVQKNENFYKIQIKWSQIKDGSITAELVKPHKNHSLKYKAEEVDVVILYEPVHNKYYWLPQEMIVNRRSVVIRTEKPKNNQIKGINWAKDYEI